MRLSREHGLNPTIPVCFWCGKEKNEILLLGASYKGEAPMSMIVDYEPCDCCKKEMAKGYALLEADRTRKYTGKWCVLTLEAAKRMGFPETPHNKCQVEIGLIDRLLSDVEAA